MLATSYEILFTLRAKEGFEKLQSNNAFKKRLKAVRKTLAYLQVNPRHPSLNTHKYSSLVGLNGEPVFEAYAENKTPAAYRVFWFYGPSKKQITVTAITKHP